MILHHPRRRPAGILLVVAVLGILTAWPMMLDLGRRTAEGRQPGVGGHSRVHVDDRLGRPGDDIRGPGDRFDRALCAGRNRSHLVGGDEAAIKYFLLGAFASAIFIYGAALTFAGTGSTNLTATGAFLGNFVVIRPAVILIGMSLLIVGMAFKVTAAPFPLLGSRRLSGCTVRGGRVHGGGCQDRRIRGTDEHPVHRVRPLLRDVGGRSGGAGGHLRGSRNPARHPAVGCASDAGLLRSGARRVHHHGPHRRGSRKPGCAVLPGDIFGDAGRRIRSRHRRQRRFDIREFLRCLPRSRQAFTGRRGEPSRCSCSVCQGCR